MADGIVIGEMDTMVTILECVITTGLQGNKKVEHRQHSKVWAKVERSINEMVGNGNLEEGNTIELTVYKIPGLTVRWRVIVEGVTYEITAIDPISRISPLNILTLYAID